MTGTAALPPFQLGENLLHRCGPFFTDDRKRPEKRDNVKAYELILQKAKEKGEVRHCPSPENGSIIVVNVPVHVCIWYMYM